MSSSAETPGPSTTASQAEKVLSRLDLLERVVPESEVNQLRVLLKVLYVEGAGAERRRGGLPQPPAIALPKDAEPLDDRAEKLAEKLQTDEQFQLLLSGLEEVLDHLQNNPNKYSQARLALLLDVLNPKLKTILSEYLKLKEDTDALTDKVVLELRTKIGLPDTSDAALRDCLTIGWGMMRLPPGGDPLLFKRYMEMQSRHSDMLDRLDPVLDWTPADSETKGPALAKDWLKYQADTEQYDRDCAEAGKKSFLKNLGLPEEMGTKDFDGLIAEVLKPLDTPDQAKNPKLKEDIKRMENVRKTYEALETDRAGYARKIEGGLFRKPISKEDQEKWASQFSTYLLKRDLYERLMLQRDSSTSKLMLYAGMVVNEIGEELGEDLFKLSDKTLYEKYVLKVPFIANLDAAARTKLLSGWTSVVDALKAKGVPTASMGKMFAFLNRTPLGPKFWGDLLKVESPATVVLWGMFMYTAEDKVKAAAQFGSFLATSKMSNRVVEGAYAAASKMIDAEIRLVQLMADGPQKAQKMARLQKFKRWWDKTPGGTAVKFSVAMLVAVGMSDTLDQLSTKLDKAIPDSETKHYIEVGLRVISTEFLVGEADELLYETGAFNVNPLRDQMQFFTNERFNLTEGPDFVQFHTIEDWNERVDQSIEAEKSKGPQANLIAIEMFKLQRIDDPVKWSERQSVALFGQVSTLRGSEKDLGTELASRGIIDSPSALNACEIAIADGVEQRNDRQLEYALGVGTGSPGLKAARLFFEDETKVPKDDPLREKWNEYVALSKEIARAVSVYKKLGLYGSKEEWFGAYPPKTDDPEGSLPPKVKRGMIEELAFRAKWAQATDRKSYPNLTNGKFQSLYEQAIRMRAEDMGWNKMVSTGVTMGGTYAAYRLFNAIGSQGRFASSSFGAFMKKIPGGTTLNGMRRALTYPITRPIMGAGPAAAPLAPSKYVASKVSVERYLRELEKTGKLSRTSADAVRRSASTTNMLADALNSGKQGAAARMISNVNRGVVMMRTLSVAGIAGDALGAYTAFLEYQSLQGKIDETDNQELKNIYSTMQTEKIAVGAFQGTSATINGITFITAGQGLLGRIAAVCTRASLPLTIAVMGGQYASGRLYEVAETWSKNGLDWAKQLGPTEIMAKLIELAPGEPSFWQEVGVLGAQAIDDPLDALKETAVNAAGYSPARLVVKGSVTDFYDKAAEKKEVANHMTRVALLHAYFINTLKLPAGTNESEDEYKKRGDLAISDAMRYMLIRSGDMIIGSTLDDALTHATLCDRARSLRQLKAKGELDEPEVLTWTSEDGKENAIDLSTYDQSVTLFTGTKSNALPAGSVIKAYRRSVNGDYALFVNASKPAPGERMSPENLQLTQTFIQNQLLERLEPYIYRLKGKLEEYYKDISVTNMENLGKKQLLEYVLFEEIRYRLAGDVQALLQKDGDVTPEDIERVFQKMVTSLVPNEGMNRKFEGLLAQTRKMNLDKEAKYYNKNPLRPEFLRANLLWNTNSKEFQQFALAHPWLVDQQVVSKDMLSNVATLREFIDDQLYQYKYGSRMRVVGEAQFRVLMEYVKMLDANPAYDPDGSVRSLIRGLDKPEYKWTVTNSVFEQATTDRTNAFARVLQGLKSHVQGIQENREYFRPPNRSEPLSRYEAVVGSLRSPYRFAGDQDVFVSVNGYQGGDLRITPEQAEQGADIRDENGRLIAVLRLEKGSSGSATWTVDVSKAEAPGKVYLYSKKTFNGQQYETTGNEIVVKAPDAYRLTTDAFVMRLKDLKNGRPTLPAAQTIDGMNVAVTLTDGTVMRGTLKAALTADKKSLAISGQGDLGFLTVQLVKITKTNELGIQIRPPEGVAIAGYELSHPVTGYRVLARKK